MIAAAIPKARALRDPVGPEQAVAFVALRPGFSVTPDELIEHCRRSLAGFKVPREVYIEAVLPKNAIGSWPNRCFATACELDRTGT
jgi:acyl-CoA synthetase (AMP-forming)/AMP-acid ligase II